MCTKVMNNSGFIYHRIVLEHREREREREDLNFVKVLDI